MRWSTRLIVIGVVIIAVGIIPLPFAGLTIGTLETTASFFVVGLLVLLIGVMLRRFQRALKRIA